MSTSVEKIKDRLNIVDVIGSYIKLEKSGNSLKAKCPFHNEKTPSFFVSAERDNYYCFGCGAKGDIFSFVEQIEGLDFRGALKLLADKAGIELEVNSRGAEDNKSRIFLILEEATKYFEKNLQNEKAPLAYLEKRGLTPKTIKDWRIGFVRDDWRTVSEFLQKKGFTEKELERAGLTKKSEDGKNVYDRFRGRIMFPIFDSAGRVVAYSGRILIDDGKSAKYLNSPETELFTKSKILYGFDKAKQSIRKFDYGVLVEGQMDLLMCHQAGFANTVASSGTALTSEHLKLLKRISNRVIMAFDADKAGQKAVERAWMIAISLGMEVKVASIKTGPNGEKSDPAELILKNKDEWKNVLKNSVHIVDFLLENVLAENLEARKIGIAVKEKILPYISLVDSDIEKSQYVSKISDRTNIKEDAIWEDLKKIKINIESLEEKSKQGLREKDELLRLDDIERRICGIACWQKSLKEPSLSVEELLREFKDRLGDDFISKFDQITEDKKNELIFEAESYCGGKSKEEILWFKQDLINQFLIERYKKEQESIMLELKRAEKDKDEEKQKALIKRFKDIKKISEDIKNMKF
jgi:DNA primase